MKLIVKIGILLFLLILVIGVWFGFVRQTTVTESLFAMGTVVEITATGKDPQSSIKQAWLEIQRIEALTTNNPGSEVARINRAAGSRAVKVKPEIIELLSLVSANYRQLQGSFDPTIGPLIDLWGFNYQGEPALPEPSKIRRVLGLVDFTLVQVDPKRNTVFLPQAGMKLDLGGIAKGYAIDRAYQILKNSGISSALINGGSSSIRVLGKRKQRSWRIGVGHPRNQGQLLGTISLADGQALGTSADTQNYFINNGTRYSHLINPKTGYPARNKILVTVTAPTAALADLLSTALFILDQNQVSAYLNEHPEIEAIIYDKNEQLVDLNGASFEATRR